MVLPSSNKLIFKLFIAEHLVEGLPSEERAWRNVGYSFLPSEGNQEQPTSLRLELRNYFNIQIQAKLPMTYEDTVGLIDAKASFVLSNPRIFNINQSSLEKLKVSGIGINIFFPPSFTVLLFFPDALLQLCLAPASRETVLRHSFQG